jgi:hypothetical protein
MRLAWATDIHLDHAGESARRKFCQSVKEQADALVVTGDIAESRILGSALTALAALTERPVYFVLGNHDFYRGSIADTRRQVAYVVGDTEGLVYLSQSGVVELTPNTALIGHDGWADVKRRTANPRPTRRGHTKGDFTDICPEITAPFSVPLLAVATLIQLPAIRRGQNRIARAACCPAMDGLEYLFIGQPEQKSSVSWMLVRFKQVPITNGTMPDMRSPPSKERDISCSSRVRAIPACHGDFWHFLP